MFKKLFNRIWPEINLENTNMDELKHRLWESKGVQFVINGHMLMVPLYLILAFISIGVFANTLSETAFSLYYFFSYGVIIYTCLLPLCILATIKNKKYLKQLNDTIDELEEKKTDEIIDEINLEDAIIYDTTKDININHEIEKAEFSEILNDEFVPDKVDKGFALGRVKDNKKGRI